MHQLSNGIEHNRGSPNTIHKEARDPSHPMTHDPVQSVGSSSASTRHAQVRELGFVVYTRGEERCADLSGSSSDLGGVRLVLRLAAVSTIAVAVVRGPAAAAAALVPGLFAARLMHRRADR